MLHIHHRTGNQALPAGSRTYEGNHAAKALGSGRLYNLVVTELPEANQTTHAILMFRRHLPLIEYVGCRHHCQLSDKHSAPPSETDAKRLAHVSGLPEQIVARLMLANNRRPRLLLRPLVVRATVGEHLEMQVTNLLSTSLLSLTLVDDDYGIQESEAAEPSAKGETHTYRWRCSHVGIYPIFNQAAVTASERRCLLGVLIIEP